MTKLRAVLTLLTQKQPIPAHYLDHPLKGNWRQYRELHIESDWLLIYQATDTQLRLARTGSHSELFDR